MMKRLNFIIIYLLYIVRSLGYASAFVSYRSRVLLYYCFILLGILGGTVYLIILIAERFFRNIPRSSRQVIRSIRSIIYSIFKILRLDLLYFKIKWIDEFEDKNGKFPFFINKKVFLMEIMGDKYVRKKTPKEAILQREQEMEARINSIEYKKSMLKVLIPSMIKDIKEKFGISLD